MVLQDLFQTLFKLSTDREMGFETSFRPSRAFHRARSRALTL